MRKKFIENSKVGKTTLRVLIPAFKPCNNWYVSMMCLDGMPLWYVTGTSVPVRCWTTYIFNIQQHTSHKKSPSLQKFAFIFVDSLFSYHFIMLIFRLCPRSCKNEKSNGQYIVMDISIGCTKYKIMFCVHYKDEKKLSFIQRYTQNAQALHKIYVINSTKWLMNVIRKRPRSSWTV